MTHRCAVRTQDSRRGSDGQQPAHSRRRALQRYKRLSRPCRRFDTCVASPCHDARHTEKRPRLNPPRTQLRAQRAVAAVTTVAREFIDQRSPRRMLPMSSTVSSASRELSHASARRARQPRLPRRRDRNVGHGVETACRPAVADRGRHWQLRHHAAGRTVRRPTRSHPMNEGRRIARRPSSLLRHRVIIALVARGRL